MEFRESILQETRNSAKNIQDAMVQATVGLIAVFASIMLVVGSTIVQGVL